MVSDAELLGRAQRAYLIAPAGFGKTHLIAETISDHCIERQLLLTHTHAGVRAMRTRLAEMSCPHDRYHIETISGWALRYATAYPFLSGITNPQPVSSADWRAVYSGALAVLGSKAIRRVVQVSYKGAFVDEYQDCTTDQHKLVLALAELLPCRILLDPLQGIFDFEQNPIDWTTDVANHFEALPPLRTPYRWRDKNERLGNWLVGVRKQIESGTPIYLRRLPSGVHWRQGDAQNQRSACFERAKLAGTIAAIHAGDMEGRCQFLARRLGGRYQCMEPVECQELYQWAHKIETATGGKRAAELIDFASACLTGVKSELATIRGCLLRGPTKPGGGIRKHLDILRLLQAIAETQSLKPVATALQVIRRMPGAILFRRELWESFGRSLKEFECGKYVSLAAAAWAVRDLVRRHGRTAELRTVSRTLLVKGLEFDHAIVLDADGLDVKQLYVALTRGSRTLTILSREPVLRPT